MQLLTTAPRDSLTDAQVRWLLTGAPTVAYGRGLELLDSDLTLLDDITDALEDGSVTRTMNADVHGTCQLKLSRDIDYATQLVRPYMTLTDGALSARFYVGAYTLRKGQDTFGSSIPSISVDGSDRLWLLNRPADAWAALADTGVIAAVLDVFAAAGVTGVLIDGTAQDKTLPADMLWPLFGTASDGTTANGTTTWLQIVNKLLSTINYRGVWCDELGRFRSQPYVDPGDRAPEFFFDFDDERNSIVSPSRTRARDLSSLPNRWVFVQQNVVSADGSSATPVDGAGLYVVDHSQVTSAPGYRKGLVWSGAPVQLPAADQESLVALGDAYVAAAERVATTLTVTTAPFPAAWHWDVYTYSDTEVGGLMTVEESAWTLDLGQSGGVPNDMQRTWSVI